MSSNQAPTFIGERGISVHDIPGAIPRRNPGYTGSKAALGGIGGSSNTNSNSSFNPTSIIYST